MNRQWHRWVAAAARSGCLVAVVSAALAAALAAADQPQSDVLLQAMSDELERSRTLRISSLDAPYFIEYGASDLHSFGVQASLGAVITSNNPHVRLPSVRVRAGDYAFDNSNYVFSDFFSGTRYDPDRLPIDDDYASTRRSWWLATDRAYKTAAEAIGRKRSALKQVTQPETLADMWKADPVQVIQRSHPFGVDEQLWTRRVRAWSSVFAAYPEIVASGVSFQSGQSTRYLANSEGTRVRVPENLAWIEIRAQARAVDSAYVRDAEVIEAREPGALPSEDQIRRTVVQLAEGVRAMAAAPRGEAYTGPVLFEGVAGPQIMAELFGSQLALTRRPVSEPGRPAPFRASDLEGRVGLRVMPEFLNVVDDPTRTSAEGQRLLGDYEVDEEGVPARPVSVVEKGVLRDMMLTRQPVRGFSASNGRARLPGAFGAKTAAYSNLIVTASESVSGQDLRKKLLELCARADKAYGIIVRKMDYPSSAALDELRRIAAASQQSGSSARPISTPLLVYRVYLDGKEELVRGLRFRNFGTRALRDIVAASNDRAVFHFLYNLAPFALMGGAQYVAPVSVIAPSLLFDEVELELPQDELLRAPVVPPPPIGQNQLLRVGRESAGVARSAGQLFR
ncbi:MAG TPA: metallopeptidase TldD-related protein [Bryobacteraceae bacterium]|nr:metallopeptidase TldD-related protein [Bryobacteraceae bacterium]